MEEIGVLDILIHRKTEEILIVKFTKKKRGTLETWFSHGRLQRYTFKEIQSNGWNIISSIFQDAQEDYVGGKSELELMTKAQLKEYKKVTLGLYNGIITIEPLKPANKKGGAIGKYSLKIALPVENNTFIKHLEKAVEDAE